MRMNRKPGSVFFYAVTGVLLVIANVGFAIAGTAGNPDLSSSALVSFLLGVTGVAMLTKAIKDSLEKDPEHCTQ